MCVLHVISQFFCFKSKDTSLADDYNDCTMLFPLSPLLGLGLRRGVGAGGGGRAVVAISLEADIHLFISKRQCGLPIFSLKNSAQRFAVVGAGLNGITLAFKKKIKSHF